jgi:hypothetical protein
VALPHAPALSALDFTHISLDSCRARWGRHDTREPAHVLLQLEYNDCRFGGRCHWLGRIRVYQRRRRNAEGNADDTADSSPKVAHDASKERPPLIGGLVIPQCRPITRATCTADHCPVPRAVGIPRWFSPAATARKDVADRP